MTEQTPAPTPPAAPTPPVPAPTPPPAPEKKPPWGDDANFSPEEAWKTIQNLRKEKGGDPALQEQLAEMKRTQDEQRAALASALGVKPEETSDADKLAKTVQGLQAQILASEKRALAVEFKVPEDMLTAPDAEALRAQATALAAFAEAAHYAATTNTPPPTPPAFQQNPGQGQGNAPLTEEAKAQAEYEKYYPTKK